jgi:hypothetical protein
VRITVNRIKIIILLIWIVWVIGLLLTGKIRLETKGIAAIAGNTKEFTDKNSYVIDGEYTVSIDLNDLESNKGKELYNDGINKINVDSVDNSDSIKDGGYRIHFRSCGQYNSNYAELISGIRHSVNSENEFSFSVVANMTAEYKDKIYKCKVMGETGLNYKDGDIFSFYIFPLEAYENDEVSLNETGTVYLTISNLYKNVWTKKQ